MKRAMFSILGLSFAAALALTSSPALARGKLTESLSRTDKQFINNTAQDGIGEVQFSQLAREKATTPEVKQLATRMFTDHNKANKELKDLATRKGVQPPNEISKDDAKQYKKLRDLSGAEFDRRYVSYLVKEHKDDIDAFQKQSKEGKDIELKGWVNSMVPKLRHHLAMVQSIEARLKTRY